MRRRGTGFTIIELLVVIAIIVIATGILVSNNRCSHQRAALDRMAQMIITDTRDVLSRSTSGEIYPAPVNAVPPGGYGIIFDDPVSGGSFSNEDYRLYADLNGNHIWNVEDGLLFNQTLPDKFSVHSITCKNKSGVGVACNPPVIISFLPPDPVVLIRRNGESNPAPADEIGEVTVVIRIPCANDCSNPEDCRKIIINASGAMSIANYP